MTRSRRRQLFAYHLHDLGRAEIRQRLTASAAGPPTRPLITPAFKSVRSRLPLPDAPAAVDLLPDVAA